YVMPVEYVEAPRVITSVSFAAYDPSSAVSLGRANATAEGCSLSVADLAGVKLWKAYTRAANSGVYTADEAAPLAEGDVDGDGEVTVADALTALRVALGLKTLPRRARLSGDLDGDGILTVSDALLILRRVAGLR
ncbi:MAG: dockerin type I repeat-containing protein, partial [Clostridia bacterium]|nr:dockerin type I repeat-containing protein [Clostridia bacterium]